MVKINDRHEFPEIIDLTQYLENPEEKEVTQYFLSTPKQQRIDGKCFIFTSPRCIAFLEFWFIWEISMQDTIAPSSAQKEMGGGTILMMRE